MVTSDGALLHRPSGVEAIQTALAAADLDGWLLYEFHGTNPVARRLLGLESGTRRSFTLIPRDGEPVALVHAIESSAWRAWPWRKERYAGWREMEAALDVLLAGHERLALEFSPRSSVPTLDLVPSGVMDLVRERGIEPVSSGSLVTAFHACWSDSQLARHRKTAAVLARIARAAFERAAEAVRAGVPTTEGALSSWILSALSGEGIAVDADCIVAAGPNSADPHYAPGDVGAVIDRGSVLLVDLWGKPSSAEVHADQTWMGFLGTELPAEVAEVWRVVRDAREAVVAHLRDRHQIREPVCGFELDDVAREAVRAAGYGDRFVHRTGHSIDTDLHGSGPNLDNLETRDDRVLVPGVGFSVEPGVYLPGRFGVRSEIDVHWSETGPEVTPAEPQDDVFLLLD